MKEITIDSIKEAYSRFKAYVYYDNFNLSLRSQLSEYENDENLEIKLSVLANELNNFLNTGKLSRRLNNLISENEFIPLYALENLNGGLRTSRFEKKYSKKCRRLPSADNFKTFLRPFFTR